MTPERWRQIDELLDKALDCEASRRAALLDETCGGDEALRRKVEELLAADGEAGSFLAAPALEVAAKVVAVDQTRRLVGESLGHYQVLALLGAGGMGLVYRAKDTRLGREVAIKVLPEPLAQDSAALARFEREARAVAALSHPNILDIHDFCMERGICFAVMELLEGETLRRRLTRGALTRRAAVEIAVAVAQGLAAAHAKGVIHRDLKPENIFLAADGRVRILDFGLARIKLGASVDGISTSSAASLPGRVLGTVGYMSPEQVRGEEADAPSDIFSFGCVLWEMVTGERAFARQSAAETMAAILRDDPPQLAAAALGAPPPLARVLRHCLEKDAAARYRSAGALAADLQALLGEQSLSETVPMRRLRRMHSMAWLRARPAVWAGVALLMLLGAAALALWRPARLAALTSSRSPGASDDQVKKVPAATPPPSKNAPVKCIGAVEKTACTPVITTTYTSTVTIQILNHANGGESCGLYSPAGSDRPGNQIMPESDIDPSNKAPQTSRNPIPAGAKFIVWCKRKADSGNADISGYVYYR